MQIGRGGNHGGRVNHSISGWLSWVFAALFYFHLILVGRAIFAARAENKYSLPLTSFTAVSGYISWAWMVLTHYDPAHALNYTFFGTPFLTWTVSIGIVYTGSPGSILLGGLGFIVGAIILAYAIRVNAKFHHAQELLSRAMVLLAENLCFMMLLLSLGVIYAVILAFGIARATASGNAALMWMIVLSLGFTMQVIRNLIIVTIGRVTYDRMVMVNDLRAVNTSMGNIVVGSVFAPVLGVIQGLGRSVNLVSSNRNAHLLSYRNVWGFVDPEFSTKGFLRASKDRWEKFNRVGLEAEMNNDISGSFCLLSGIAVGAATSLLAVSLSCSTDDDEGYPIQQSIYCFLIGYLLGRISMAYPQACAVAYYVAYSDYPHSLFFDSLIPDFIGERVNIHEA